MPLGQGVKGVLKGRTASLNEFGGGVAVACDVPSPIEGCTYPCAYANTSRVRHVYVYAHAYTRICPCARVNGVSGPFFREGGLRAPSQTLSLCVYNMPTVSTISRPRPFMVHSVYRLYLGHG